MLPMVGETSEPGGFEAGLSGFADRSPSAFVFIVGGDIADAGVKPDAVVVAADDGEFGS